MNHHRLVLNGPPEHVDALARALLDAGAEPVPGADPPCLTWATPAPLPLPSLGADHPRVNVGVERFALLGETVESLVLRGGAVTILERRPFAPVNDDDPHPLLTDATLADCAPLPPPLLHAAAMRVADQSLQLGPNPTSTTLDDALLVGAAIGHVCTAALAAPLEDVAAGEGGLPLAVRDALAALAATAITAAAATTDPASSGELDFERAHQLTEAHAVAGAERLWSRPGNADWPEWLMYILLGAASVVEDCAVALHQPPPPVFSLHAEHGATREERLGHATTRLVATCLQALALFDPAPSGPGGCARN